MSSVSESEGEIIETEADKATTALPSVTGTSVDRQSRSRAGSVSRSPRVSPESDSGRDRSRSPYRHKSPRGEKRRRIDDYDERERPDPRRFRVYYEDGLSNNGDRRRRRNSYVDLDRNNTSHAPFDYDERRPRDRKHWPRSRSPDVQTEDRTRHERDYRGSRRLPNRRQRDARDRDFTYRKRKIESSTRPALENTYLAKGEDRGQEDRAVQEAPTTLNGHAEK